MRITKTELQGVFKVLVRILNTSHKKETTYTLDYAACYGGYVIEEKCNETGGIHHPFGARRRTTREMYLSMLMTTSALEGLLYANRARGE